METALLENQVIPQLWAEYKKLSEYKKGAKKAIPPNHRCVIEREEEGLKSIYRQFVYELSKYVNVKNQLKLRNASEWEKEWLGMNKKLFEYIMRNCGKWRTIEVRFGNPGDEELHRIPKPSLVPNAIAFLAAEMTPMISQDNITKENKYKILARIHYQLVRIHPFNDGNGRIARAVTDQLSILFGFPPTMGGYPRMNIKKREAYHKAINACIEDVDCHDLARWIGSYIESQIENIA